MTTFKYNRLPLLTHRYNVCQHAMSRRLQGDPVLYITDMRMLPGMEGGPVTDAAGGLVGMLWLPVYSAHAGAEVPLVMPAGVLAAALATNRSGHRSSSGWSAEQPTAAHGISPSAAATDGSDPLRHSLDASVGSRPAVGDRLVAKAASAEGSPWLTPDNSLRAPQQRRLASLAATVWPSPAGRPPDLAPALALARRGVVGVVAAGGRWASGVVVNP